MRITKDRVFSLVIIAFSLFMIWQTSRLTSLYAVSERDSGPRLFPYFTCGMMGICAVGKFLTSGREEAKPFLTREGWRRVAVMFLAFAAYLLAMSALGFLIATPVFAAVFAYLMKEDRRINPFRCALFAVVLTLVLYYVFQYAIKVTLPRGLFY